MDPVTSAKLSRRQSLPEAMLSTAHSGSLYHGAAERPKSPPNEDSEEMGVSEHKTISINYPGIQIFKHSDTGRFAKSKRKSQSLYEPQSQNNQGQRNLENQMTNAATSSGEMSTKEIGHLAQDLPAGTNLSGNAQNGDKTGNFNGLNEYLLEEKHAKQEEGHEDEADLDFLFTMPKHNNNFNGNGVRREQKVTHPQQELDVGMFSRNGPASFSNASRKVRRSVHETRPSEPMYQTYEQGFHTFDDNFNHNANGISSLPTFASPYDNFQGFNPLNNIHPFQLNPNPMNAFQMNPLNNFGMNGLAYDHYGGFNNMTGESGIDMKKRRSRVPSSVYRGVSRCGKDNKFQARIRVHGKVKYLGRFKSEIEAAKCYDKHAIEYLGVNAQTNFPYTPTQQTSS